ncbi:MAG: hypothetical protein GY913_27240 [Proteobacteria bacterium]|nr:hypothetical protein [Pseudomonadota bacterium]MCP4920610.1 hypothetical protein [Pseudomonadota bacterium]
MLLLSLIACPLPTPGPDSAEPGVCDLELPDPTVPAVQSCPGETTFDPVVKWQWSDCEMGVVMTPVVGDLDEDGISDVVFTAFDVETAYTTGMHGELMLVSGDGSVTELWHVTEIEHDGETYYPSGRGNIAMGDLDLDGTAEVCVVMTDASVMCLNYDGTPTPVVKFHVANTDTLTAGENSTTGSPAIANMLGDSGSDPEGELVWGRILYDHTGAIETASPGGFGSPGGSQGQAYNGQIGHADDDGYLELLTGTTAWDLDEEENWYFAADGAAASADLDGDGTYEVVSTFTDIWTSSPAWTTWLGVHIGIDPTPPATWDVETTEIVNGEVTGGPTIANLDDDDALEVAVSGYHSLQVFDYDPASMTFTEQWSMSINDTSSSILSSAAVDWDNDGIWELLYADEDDLYLIDVTTGTNLFVGTDVDPTDHESPTRVESPSVADLDGDGSLELIVPSARNPGNTDQWSGITVIGSATDSWAGTGRVWNQANFVPGRVDDDLAIVETPGDNPEGWRAAESFPPTTGADKPDLVLLEAEKCEDCPDLYSWVAVANIGTVDAGNFLVSAYDGGGVLIHQETVLALASGEVVWAGPLITTSSTDVTWVADDLDQIDECDEDNNELEYSLGACP